MPRPEVDYRDRILAAARALLGEGAGLEGLTSSALAQKTGISRATFYRQYPSVEQVILDLSAYYERVAVERLQGVLSSGLTDEHALIERIVDGVVEAVTEHAALTRAVRREELAFGSLASARRRERMARQQLVLRSVFEARFGVAPDDETLFTWMVLLHDGAMHAVAETEHHHDPSMLDRYRGALAHTLIAAVDAWRASAGRR